MVAVRAGGLLGSRARQGWPAQPGEAVGILRAHGQGSGVAPRIALTPLRRAGCGWAALEPGGDGTGTPSPQGPPAPGTWHTPSSVPSPPCSARSCRTQPQLQDCPHSHRTPGAQPRTRSLPKAPLHPWAHCLHPKPLRTPNPTAPQPWGASQLPRSQGGGWGSSRVRLTPRGPSNPPPGCWMCREPPAPAPQEEAGTGKVQTL